MPARIAVKVPGGESPGYEVLIGPGTLESLAARCRERAPAHRYAVISDSRVAELYGPRVISLLREAGLTVDLFAFPSGEWNKTRETWAELSDELLAEGYGRDCAVIALGGGVTGDVAGFVASTFKRGVAVVQVPTTLLAMVDSAVGGKTGVDAAGAKNVFGTFHHPADVVVDPELLATLPKHQLIAGYAEAVKMGAILDANLFADVESMGDGLRSAAPADLTSIVERCVELKAGVVGRDPREAGERGILNFGHTAGHALEALAGFSILHGEAVAAGMRLESRMGEHLGVTASGTTERLAAVLDACGLPEVLDDPDLTAPRILDAARHDKKARSGELRWVLLDEIGRVHRSDEGEVSRHLNETTELEAMRMALRTAIETADSAT